MRLTIGSYKARATIIQNSFALGVTVDREFCQY